MAQKLHHNIRHEMLPKVLLLYSDYLEASGNIEHVEQQGNYVDETKKGLEMPQIMLKFCCTINIELQLKSISFFLESVFHQRRKVREEEEKKIFEHLYLTSKRQEANEREFGSKILLLAEKRKSLLPINQDSEKGQYETKALVEEKTAFALSNIKSNLACLR